MLRDDELLKLRERDDLVAFIQCVQQKRPGSHQAWELYTSAYFRRSFQLASLLVGDRSRIFVLSAKYGILALDDVVESYNISLHDLSSEQQGRWRDGIRKFVDKEVIGRKMTPVLICGDLYSRTLPGINVLPKSDIGFQVQFMVRAIKLLRKQKVGFGL